MLPPSSQPLLSWEVMPGCYVHFSEVTWLEGCPSCHCMLHCFSASAFMCEVMPVCCVHCHKCYCCCMDTELPASSTHAVAVHCSSRLRYESLPLHHTATRIQGHKVIMSATCQMPLVCRCEDQKGMIICTNIISSLGLISTKQWCLTCFEPCAQSAGQYVQMPTVQSGLRVNKSEHYRQHDCTLKTCAVSV